MNTLLLKVGCLFLFGFIFFQSFQAEQANANQLLSQELKTEQLSQKAVVITVSADVHSSTIADYETNGYLNATIDK